MPEPTPLCLLAATHGTAKGLQHPAGSESVCHAYTPVYDRLFAGRRDAVRYVLEIGIGAGGSLRMWEAYFPQALIVGFDTDPACLGQAGGRVSCYRADATKGTDIEAALAHAADFDLIVDDGSHVLRDQVASLKLLLPRLNATGIYAVEGLRRGSPPADVGRYTPAGWRWEAFAAPYPGACACGCGQNAGVSGDLLVIHREKV